jgi:RNA polymerase sigma-70 factor (ECF subfamily)
MTAQDCAVLTMAAGGDSSVEKAQRFRVEALPYLNDVYTVARYLLRNAEDAEDATQECYLRAFRHFETFRGGSIKPWLLAILRNVCRAEYARRGALAAMPSESLDAAEQSTEGLWSDGDPSPEAKALGHLDGESVQRLIAQLPDQFREALVLREINELSYREISEVIGAPVGTVMSRLARARALLREAWIAEENGGAWGAIHEDKAAASWGQKPNRMES